MGISQNTITSLMAKNQNIGTYLLTTLNIWLVCLTPVALMALTTIIENAIAAIASIVKYPSIKL
jgi:hypothetical protein